MEYNYSITASYDGKLFGTYRYAGMLEAAEAWARFVDHGNAEEYATYNLSDPTGKMYTKTFYANGDVQVRV